MQYNLVKKKLEILQQRRDEMRLPNAMDTSERIVAKNFVEELIVGQIEGHFDDAKVVCFEVGDHNSVIPFFEKRVLQLHRVEIGWVCREGQVRVTQDRFEANFEPDRSDVVVVWNLHRRIVKEPGMFDDKLHQTR